MHEICNFFIKNCNALNSGPVIGDNESGSEKLQNWAKTKIDKTAEYSLILCYKFNPPHLPH